MNPYHHFSNKIMIQTDLGLGLVGFFFVFFSFSLLCNASDAVTYKVTDSMLQILLVFCNALKIIITVWVIMHDPIRFFPK